MNLLFWNLVRYFNGNSIYPTELAKRVDFQSRGFFFNTELLVKALRINSHYHHIPYSLNPRRHGKSKALQLKSVFSVIIDVLKLRLRRAS